VPSPDGAPSAAGLRSAADARDQSTPSSSLHPGGSRREAAHPFRTAPP
jgi:hypothetical protein